jgi:hypothetical protein
LELEKRQFDKIIEKKHLEEETVLTETAPALSLSDLISAKPVDFRGREMKTNRPSLNHQSLSNQAPKEQELTEGEEMTITNNQF